MNSILKGLRSTLLLALAVSTCASASALGKNKKDLPPETSDREIIQLAQQAFNNDNFKLADYYYNVLLQRYGNNIVDYIIGKYEIGHIAIRKKDYATAVPIMEEILDIYAETPAGELPASYRVLAMNDLKRIPERARSGAYSTRGNDYYENDDYGDTDFFGEFPSDSSSGYEDSDSGYDDGGYGSYGGGFYF